MAIDQESAGERPKDYMMHVNSKGFYFFEDAIEYLQGNCGSRNRVYLRCEIPGGIDIRVSGAWYEHQVTLKALGREVRLPRASSDNGSRGISVQAHLPSRRKFTNVPCENMIIRVGDYYTDQDLDRGLAWLIPGQYPEITFTLEPGERNAENIKEVFSRVQKKTIDVVTNALNGIYPKKKYE